MQKKALTEKHLSKLSEYGLRDASLENCMCLHFKAGETILQEGMPVTCLSIVMSGRAKVCVTAQNGKNLVLCYYVVDGVIGEEGIIGDIELVTGTETATATIIAITDFECLAIPFHRNAVNLKRNIEFMNRIGNALATKLIMSSDNYAAAALYSCEERLCAYILQTSHNGVFSDILTDVACSVGMSYRHMFRILNRLCDAGLLEKQNCGYRILNRDGLMKKAPNAKRTRIYGKCAC